MAPNSLTLHKPVCDFLIVIQASALPGLLHVIALTEWTELLELKMNLKFKNVTKKSLQQNGHLLVVLYCTNQSTGHLCAFLFTPTDCI
jgi:hypothetical protein